MNFPLVEEKWCAICHEHVWSEFGHMKFVVGFGRRLGRMHTECVPPDLEAWLTAEDERLYREPRAV